MSYSLVELKSSLFVDTFTKSVVVVVGRVNGWSWVVFFSISEFAVKLLFSAIDTK